MRRNNPSETPTPSDASPAEETPRDTAATPRAHGRAATRDPRAGRALRGLVSCVLVFLLFYQPSIVMAGSLASSNGSGGGVNVFAAAASTAGEAFGYVASFFGAGEPAAEPPPITDAAVSRNRPVLTGGRVEGTLRVFAPESYTLNSPFELTGDLYTAGTPSVILNGNATHGGVVDDGGAATPAGHTLTLGSGIALPGKIHRRADPLALPTVPASVPAPAGTRSLNVNSAADAAQIGDWRTVRDLTVSSGAVVNAPPGNYGTFTVNGNSRINLSAGAYSFTGPLDLNGNGVIQVTGKVVVNVGQGVKVGDVFSVNSGAIVAGAGTLPGDVILNIIGTAFAINGTGQVTGIIRAPNATVTFNGNGATLRGQVIANSLVMKGGKIIGDISATPPPDQVAPTLQIDSPANNSTTTDAAVRVTVTVADSGPQATGVAAVFVNNQPATLDPATGKWVLASLALALGPNTVEARAVDGAGNQATASAVVTREEPKDTTNPSVAISSPAAGSTIESDSVNITGTAGDPGAPSSGVNRVVVNGTTAAFNPQTGAWSVANFPLSVGPNQLTATAFDNAGNSSSAVVNVVRAQPADTQKPQVAIDSPASGSATIEAEVSVSGTASDPGDYQTGVASVIVNGVTASYDPATGRWTAANVPVSLGPNQLTATATDGAGNRQTASVSVTRNEPPDTAEPNLVVSEPADNSTTDALAVNVSGTASDTGANASGVAWVKVNGTPAPLNPTTGAWTLEDFALALGPNAIEVRAADRAGNETVKTVRVTRVLPPDTTAPVLTIDAPADNVTVPDETVTVTGTATDEGLGAAGVAAVKVNGIVATYDPATKKWTAAGVPLNEGPNSIVVVATDAAPAANSREASITVTRRTPDRDAPVVVIAAPLPGVQTYASTVDVAGSATDDGLNATGVKKVTVNGREAAYDPATKQWSLDGLALEYGDNLVVVVATDGAEPALSGRAEVHVVRQRIPPPTLVVTNPQNGGVYAAGTVTVAGTVTTLSTDPVTVTVNGEATPVGGGNFAKTVTLAEGANTISVVARDALGQETQSSFTILRDQTAPTVNFVAPPVYVQAGASYQITVEAEDNVGVAEVVFSVGGERVGSSAARPYLFTLHVPAALAAGNTLTLSATARDLSGASTTVSAQARLTGPGGLSGYAFDDATGYPVVGAQAQVLGETAAATDEEGTYSLVSSSHTGVVRLWKDGHTFVERIFAVTPGEGGALLDARLTKLDAHANPLGAAGGAATGDAGRLRVEFAAGVFNAETDVRVTSVSPQGLANLLPYGWSPVPGAVVDVRAGEAAFATPARLRVASTPVQLAGLALTLARYDEQTHGWRVVAANLTAGADGSLEVNVDRGGQYAFLVADRGATAPPPATPGSALPSGVPADAAALDAAEASAVASPSAAGYSAQARSTISFLATAPAALPSGVAIEASFGETYTLLGGKDSILVDRPRQDFILYSFPAATVENPRRLGADFIAKPTRTEFTVTELLGANIHVDIRSGRQAKTGVLVGANGGVVRAGDGSTVQIPSGAFGAATPVFFDSVAADSTGLALPEGYEIVAAFELNLSGSGLARGATISSPAPAGDNSRVVVARLLNVGGRGPEVVARAVETEDGRLVSSTSAPAVPEGVALRGVVSSGRYVFVRVPSPFGYVVGTATGGGAAAKVSGDRTPFVYVTGADGRYALVGAAGAAPAGVNQLGAQSLSSDATGAAPAALAAQDAVAAVDIALASAAPRVVSVAPAAGAANLSVTTPVTVTFNKPVTPQTVTASAFKVTTAAGNPVLGAITVLAGNRVAVLTPAATLAASTRYVVAVSQAVRDVYGQPLAEAFQSDFTTAAPVPVSGRLRPEQIRIDYPDDAGTSRVVIPAGTAPEGSTVVAINTTSGSTVTTVAGEGEIVLRIPATVGDEIVVTVRQPDGSEYSVSQAAYRRADGATSVGSNGGAIMAPDGKTVLVVPEGALTGVADITLTPKGEESLPIPRSGGLEESVTKFGAGVEIKAEGNFTCEQELHLELPAPAGAVEGQVAAFLTPIKVKDESGQMVEVWDSLTSGRVRDGKIKSNSPPWPGIFIGQAHFLIIWAFMPTFGRAVTGQVRGYPTNQPVAGATVLAGSYNTGWYGRMVGRTNQAGRFTLFEFAAAPHDEAAVPLKVYDDLNNRQAVGTASTSGTFEERFLEGLSGFALFRGDVLLPAIPNSPTGGQPPGIQVVALSGGVPLEQDALYTRGIATVGTGARIIANSDRKLAQITGTMLVGGVATRTLTWTEQATGNENIFQYYADVEVTAEGAHAVTVKGSTAANDPASTTTAVLNFIGLRNPNTRPPLAGPPSVIHVNPADGMENVELTTDIRLEFSEPVRNLIPGQTIYVQEEGETVKIGGSVVSGGTVVGPTTPGISSIAFRPATALPGGRKFTVHVTDGVVDDTGGGLDQEYTGEGDSSKRPFSSTFTTFEGLVLTEQPLAELASRITVAGQYAYTVGPFSSTNTNGSRLNVYDASEPHHPTLRSTLSIPQRAFDLSVTESEEDAFKVDGRAYVRIAAITTVSPLFPEQHANVWFVSLDDPAAPEIVGVTSLYLPHALPSTPLSVKLHRGRAYVGSSPYRGVSVVDVAHSVRLFAEGKKKGKNPIVEAVKAPGGTTGITNSGWGQEAKVQTVTVEQLPILTAQIAAGSISVMDQLAAMQSLPPTVMPVVYVANNPFKTLIEMGFPRARDNRNGITTEKGALPSDDRLFVFKEVDPKTSGPSMVRTIKGAFVDNLPRDMALLLSAKRLWIFDASTAGFPRQYVSKTFEELGIPGSARYFDVEGTLAYVVMDNDIAVIDFSEPESPRQVARLTGLGTGLRALAVKDGFIYSLSPGSGAGDGLNVSIAVPASRVFVAGASADPGLTCSGPVVIDRATKTMRQAASINFQVFGRSAPKAQSVVIRKGEDVIATVAATLLPSSNERVTLGRAEWNSAAPIDRTASYTAELVLDQSAAAEYRSAREPIPFSYLIENYGESMQLVIAGDASTADEKPAYGYVLGAASQVTLNVNGAAAVGEPRGFGINVELPSLPGLAPGRYPFTLRAEMAGNPSVSDQVGGTLVVARTGGDARPPGHTLVGGVDISSGNLAESVADVPEIKNRGVGLSFVRSYNSAAANDFTPLGYGWHHNFEVLLTFRRNQTGGGTYSLRGGDGSGQTFKAATPTGYLFMKAEKPHHGTLVRNPDGSFDFFTPARVRYHFPGAFASNDFNFYDQSYMGNLEWLQEPNGNRLTLGYDAQGRMTTVTDSSGRQLEFTYEAAPSPFAGVVAPVNASRTAQSCVPRGQFSLLRTRFAKAQVGQVWRLKQVKGPGGLVVDYAHDADGNLTSVTRKGADSISSATADAKWEYGYKPAAQSAAVDTTHLLKSATDPNGHTTSYDYWLERVGAPVKSIARPEGVTNNFTYALDGANRPSSVEVTDGRAAVTRYTLSPDGYTTAVDAPRGARTTMAFNAEGQKTEEVDPLGTKTAYEYDAKGNLRRQTQSGGDASASTETTYDPSFAKPTSSRDANGNVTTYTLDSRGNVTLVRLPTGATRSFDYRSNGDLAVATDERGLTTSYAYDAYGNPSKVTHQIAAGSSLTAEYTYDARSRMTGRSDSVRPNVTRSYDALDRVVNETVSDPTGYRDSLTTAWTYNAGGGVLTRGMSGGGQSLNETYAYDGLDRVKSISTAASGVGSSIERSFTYDANSNLKSESDRRGVTTTYEYDALNFVTSSRVSGPFGGGGPFSTAEPDLVGNPTRTTDLHGQETTYSYDGLHRLRARTLPGGYTEEQTLDANGNVVSAKDRNGRVTSTTYDGLNRPVSRRDPAGRTQAWTYDDASGTTTQVWTPQNLSVAEQKDALGRLVRREVSFAGGLYATRVSYSGRLRVTVDARNHTFHEDLSASGDVANFVAQAGGQTVRTESRYGAFGGLKSFKDANGHSATFTLDGLNRQVSASMPGGFSQSWDYDGEGLVLSHTDMRGVTTTTAYDNLRRALSHTVAGGGGGSIPVLTVAYDDGSLRQTRTDANGQPTELVYDGLGRLKSLKNAAGQTRSLEYDGVNLRREGDFKGAFTEYQYDPVDRAIEVKDRAGQATLIAHSDAGGYTRATTDRRGQQRVEAFDALGRLTGVTLAGQQLASFKYDANGNRTEAVDGRNNRAVYSFDELNRVTSCDHAGAQTETFAYDAAGNVTSYSDGRGGALVTEYDALGHPKSRTDGAGNKTTFRYDPAGLLLEKAEPKGAAYKTTYEYNALGSLRKVTDAEGGDWVFDYDGNQNLKSFTDARHHTTAYEYDPVNRLKSVRRPTLPEVTYGYDANSNRTSVRDGRGQDFTLGYDALDRRVSSAVSGGGVGGSDRYDYAYDPESNLTGVRQTRVSGPQTQVKQHALSYDARGRLQSATDEFGKTVAYEYDGADNVTRLVDAAGRQTVYSYDARNRLRTAALPGDRTVSFDWHADGLLQRVAYGHGLHREYTYDDADRLTRISNQVAHDGVAPHREEFAYTYDANSNVETETRTFDNANVRTARYGYDHLDRLTRAAYVAPGATPEASELSWIYDAAGNRQSESGTAPNGAPVGRTYQYDAVNRLTQMTDSSSGGYRFEYDGNGNLRATKAGDGTLLRGFDYDARDQLRAVLDGQQQELARYDYDYANRRTQKVLPGGAEQRFAYDGLHVLDEFDGRGRLTASYEYGGGPLRADFAGEGERFFFADGLGSTSSLSQLVRNGEVTTSAQVASYSYDAWGALSGGSGASANSLLYTGQRLDRETGMMPLGAGARYYSPDLGRFAQQDTFAGVPGVPMSLNRYAYAHSNPVVNTDPSGHLIPLLIAAVALLAIATADGYYKAEARRLERGLTQEQAGNSLALGLSDATGMTSLFNGITGQDAYTGRDLSAGERVFQGALGVVGLVGTATMVTQIGSGVLSVGRTGLAASAEAGGGLAGLRSGLSASGRQVGRSVMDEAAGTIDELTTIKPFRETRFGKQMAETRVGRLLESADDQGRAVASRMSEGVNGMATRLKPLRQKVSDFWADETGSLDLGGGGIGSAGKATRQVPPRGYVSNFREIRAKAKAAKAGDVGAKGEIEAAKLLRSEGTNVHFQTPVGPRGPGTADFRVGGEKGTGVGGVVTDVLTPRTAKPPNVLLSIADKDDQAEYIIVNLRYTSAPIRASDLGDVYQGLKDLGVKNIKTVRFIE